MLKSCNVVIILRNRIFGKYIFHFPVSVTTENISSAVFRLRFQVDSGSFRIKLNQLKNYPKCSARGPPVGTVMVLIFQTILINELNYIDIDVNRKFVSAKQLH